MRHQRVYGGTANLRLPVLFAAGIAGLGARLSPRMLVVQGQSMAPTLRTGSIHLLGPAGTPRRGEIVVFGRAGRRYVKRVVAVAGDRVPLIHYPDGTRDVLKDWWWPRFEKMQHS